MPLKEETLLLQGNVFLLRAVAIICGVMRFILCFDKLVAITAIIIIIIEAFEDCAIVYRFT